MAPLQPGPEQEQLSWDRGSQQPWWGGGFVVFAGRGDIQPQLDSALQDVNDKYLLLEETEKQAVRKALIEERGRFCTFISMLRPVIVSGWGTVAHVGCCGEQLVPPYSPVHTEKSAAGSGSVRLHSLLQTQDSLAQGLMAAHPTCCSHVVCFCSPHP